MPRISNTTDEWLRGIDKRLRMLGKIMVNTLPQAPIQFTIGDGNPGTPADGSDTYPNATLDGLDISVYLTGTGYLVEGVDYDILAGGGFTLLSTTFDTGATYIIYKV